MKTLKHQNIKAKLIVGSIFKTPYKSNFFDRIVCVSVMEHFKGKELNRATKEMMRILKPGGYLVFGFPVKNALTDMIIERALKFQPDHIHPSSHKQIIQGISEEAPVDKIIHYFPFVPRDLSLYCALRVRKPKRK
jgi:predicted SAM-dependent methyltransferase